MLEYGEDVWLIDHGAALYFHHNWPGYKKYIADSFPFIRDHVLLSRAGEMEVAHQWAVQTLTDDVINDIVSYLPDSWLEKELFFSNISNGRDVYRDFLLTRRENSENFLQEAIRARRALL